MDRRHQENGKYIPFLKSFDLKNSFRQMMSIKFWSDLMKSIWQTTIKHCTTSPDPKIYNPCLCLCPRERHIFKAIIIVITNFAFQMIVLFLEWLSIIIFSFLSAEVQTDVKLLLECLKCQVSNPTALKQALLTLSNILSSYGRYNLRLTMKI